MEPSQFVDRIAELDYLNSLQTRTKPTVGQLLLLYGRRRVGKTALLRHWVTQSGLPLYLLDGGQRVTGSAA